MARFYLTKDSSQKVQRTADSTLELREWLETEQRFYDDDQGFEVWEWVAGEDDPQLVEVYERGTGWRACGGVE